VLIIQIIRKTAVRTMVLVSLFTFSGCSTSLVSYGPRNSSTVGEGISYYLPIDVIEINSKTITTAITSVKFNVAGQYLNQNDITACFDIKERKKKVVSVDPINSVTVSDPTVTYSLSVDPDWFSSGELIVKRGSAGLLKEISIKDDGRADEAALSAVQAVAAIAGAATGIQGISDVELASVIPDKIRLLSDTSERSDDQTREKCSTWHLDQLGTLSKMPTGKPELVDDVLQAWEMAVAQLAAKSFTDAELLALFADSSLIELIRRVEFLKNYLLIKSMRLDLLEDEISQSTEIGITKTLVQRRLESEILLKQSKLNDLSVTVVTKVKGVSDEFGIGVASSSVSKNHVFRPEELPTFSEFQEWVDSNYSCSLVMKDNWNKQFCDLGVGVAMVSASEIGDPQNLTGASLTSDTTAATFDADAAYVYYRDPIPYLYKLYIQKYEGIKKAGFNEEQTGLASLFSSTRAPAAVKFEASSTSERGLEMHFSDGGVLIDVSYNYSSGGESTAAALLAGSNAALTSYESSLKKAQSINGSRRALEKDKLTYEIDLLKSQKELLDARIQLTGYQASVDSVKRSAELAQRISLLEAESSYLDAQLQSTSQRSSAIEELEELGLIAPTGNSSSTSATNELRTKIQELELQLEMIRLQQELRLQGAIVN
jgi:uncharacterized small protein (DUF1192 family)